MKTEKTVQRWDSKKKQHSQVQCPYIVASYNASVGGVNLVDMLIALYHTKIMTKKRWYLKIIFHIVDICKFNGWLLYCHHCKQNSIASKHQMSLLSFVTDVSLALRQSSKPVLLGRKKISYSLSWPKVGKKATLPKPFPDVRYLIDHFPEFTEKREMSILFNGLQLCNLQQMLDNFYVYARIKIASTIFITKEKSFYSRLTENFQIGLFTCSCQYFSSF